MRELKQSTAANVMVFVTASSDHITGATGATLTITASKNGAAFASITPTVTERGSGWYSLALTAAHTDTLGDLALHITAASCDPADVAMRVIAMDKTVANTPANVIQVNGTAQTAGDLAALLTTLTTRIPAALFSGITSLAQWLGLIAGKQTGNSTARTELRATGAGSGTYDETTDSLEAIRDNASGSAGTGARTVTITVDDGADAIESARVRMTKGAETYIQSTDVSGVATFSLDDGTWGVAITRVGYTFTPTTLVVDGAETPTYSMTLVGITPGSATETTGYITVRDSEGVEVEGATVQVQILKFANGTTASAIDHPLATATTDADGLAEFPGLPRLATYRVRVGTDGEWFKGVTADATTTPLAAALGSAE